MAYIGAEPLPGQNREVDDISSSFNGSTTAFTLQVSGVNVSPESANNILVNLGGVIQNPGTDYTIAASTITFTTAPASGLSFFALILGAGINTATVADQTIGTSKVLDNAITADKLAHTSVTAGSYTTADITVDAQGRITAAASGSISNAEIANNAVTTAKIADSTGASDGVTTAKLATDAVTAAKLADNAVVNASVDASAAIAGTKISPDFGSQNIATTGSATIGSDLIHAGDTDTKIGFGTDTISLTTNNVTRMTFTGNFIDLPDAGTLRLGNSNDLQISHGSGGASNIVHSNTSQPLKISATGAGNIAFLTDSNERMRVDSSGRLLIGATSAQSISGHTPRFQLQGTEYNSQTFSIISNSADANAAYLFLSKQRSGAVGGSTSVQNGDRIGEIRFNGHDGNDFAHETAIIASEVDGTPSTNDMPGRLLFFTCADGAGAVSERMRIDNSGNVLIGQNTTTSPGQGNTTTGICLNSAPRIFVSRADAAGLLINRNDDGDIAIFYRGGVQKGKISITSSAVAYNTTTSDRATKKNFESWTEDVSTLFKNINPQKFNFNFQEDTDTKIKGFVAQDLVSSFPEAYNKGDDDLYQFNPSGMVVYLMKALQESVTKIETLETKVAALEAA